MPSSRLKNWNTMPMWRRRMRASSSSFVPVIDLAGDRDLAVVGDVEPGDEVEQRRLAAARRTHDRDELPRARRRGRRRAARAPARARLRTSCARATGTRAHVSRRFASPLHCVSFVRVDTADRSRAGKRRPASPVPSTCCASSGSSRRRIVERRHRRVAQHRRAGRARQVLQPLRRGSPCRRRACTRAARRSRAARPRPRRSTGRCRDRTGCSPSARHCSFDAPAGRVHRRRRPRAPRSAWSSCGNGAPNTAITASPTYCMTVPPSSRIGGVHLGAVRVELPGQRRSGRCARRCRSSRARPT